MSYAPETAVLVAVVNNLADWQRIVQEGWYRIPLKRAPGLISAEILAFYQTSAFGAEGCCVRWYAPIARCLVRSRRELLPDAPDHPRAAEQYWRFELGGLTALPRPIQAARLRRITFIATYWSRLLSAHDVADLWLFDEAIANLCHALEAEGVNVTRRRLRDERADQQMMAIPAHAVLVLPTLDGAWVQSQTKHVYFTLMDMLWNGAACAAQVRTWWYEHPLL